jgi:hypothetical protein
VTDVAKEYSEKFWMRALVNGSIIFVLISTRHPKCFQCNECHKGLANGAFKAMGKVPFCVNCFNKPELTEKRGTYKILFKQTLQKLK